MTQFLQRTILSFFVSAFLILAFTSTSQAQELEQVWERTNDANAESSAPDWFTTATVRGMAYADFDDNARLYVADRTNMKIQVLDANTGADVVLDAEFDLSGVELGFYEINGLESSSDGKLFLGNMTLNASAAHPFKFYLWDSEGGAPISTFSLTTVEAHRLGDKFTVVGSVEDNTAEVWIPASGTTTGVIYVATTEDQGANWDVETITLTGDNVAIGSGADATPLAPGRTSDFYVGSNSSAPVRYTSAGAYVTGSEFTSTSRSGLAAFNMDGTDYLSVYSFRDDGSASGDRNGRAYIYDVSDATAPSINASTALMGTADNGNSISGDAQVKLNNDGSYDVYVLDGGNGLAAFTNAEPEAGLFTEQFDYSTGSLLTDNGWAAHSGEGSNSIAVVDDTLSYAGYAASALGKSASVSGGGEDVNRATGTYSSGSVYASALVNVSSATTSGDYFFHIAPEEMGFDFRGRVFVKADDTDNLAFGLSKASGGTIYTDHVYQLGETVLLVLEYTFVEDGDDITNLYINPAGTDLPDAPALTHSDGGDITDVGTIALRQGSASNAPSLTIGGIQVGSDYSEVVGNPEAQVTIPDPLAGEYYIPQGENTQGFASLADAISAINEAGLSAATTLYIAADLTETSGIGINRDDLTEDTPLTIKPAAGVTATLDVVSNGGDGIAIISADYVTIDGSNTADGDTRDLTITSSDVAIVNMVWIKETVNTTIKNTIFTFTGTGYVNGITPNESGSHSSTGWLIENNQIGTEDGTFRTGVGLWGFGDNKLDESLIIGNDIYTAHRGVTSYLDSNSSVIGNNITIVNPRENQLWYGGIYFAGSSGTTNIIGNNITGLQVNRTTDPSYSVGISLNGNDGTVNVVNNMVSAPEFKNVGEATGNEVFGMKLTFYGGTAHNNVYHNTILVGSSSETGVHAAFGSEEVETTQTWDFQNNIFTVAHDADNAYAFHWPMAGTGLSADYNNYSVLGSSASVGFFGSGDDGSATASLEDWQTATEQDEFSTTASVEFVSETNLRLDGSSIGDDRLGGIPLAAVTTDIDGTERSAEHPYKGAFEGDTPVPNEAITDTPSSFSLSQNYPNPFNPTSNIVFNLPQAHDVKLEVYNINGQLVRTLVNDRMSAGEHTVQFDAGDLASGIYVYRIIAGSFVQTKKMTLIK
ncbi:MAG: T9SS type A sorting domain-containing protein [Balneolaceae bacterium]